MNLFREAASRLTFRLVLVVAAGALLLALLGALWLLIPDSHASQLAFSFLLAAFLVCTALLLGVYILRALRKPTIAQPQWMSAIILAGWLFIGWAIRHVALLTEPGMEQRAGYWNSRLSASMRATFTAERLGTWQADLLRFFLAVLLPAVVLPFLVETVAVSTGPGSWRRAFHVLASWRHWLAAVILLGVAAWLTPRLIDWHPTDTVSGEIVSAGLRLLLTFAVDILLLLMLPAIDSVLLFRATAPPPSSDSL